MNSASVSARFSKVDSDLPDTQLDLYEILIASPEDVKWVEGSRGRLNLSALGARPVEGGYESNAEALFVAQAYHEHVWRPGKHSVGLPSESILHSPNTVGHRRGILQMHIFLTAGERS